MPPLNTLEDAVAARMFENSQSPAARTRGLLGDARECLHALESDRARHIAETEVVLGRFDRAVDGSMSNLKVTEAAIREDLARCVAEQQRQHDMAGVKRNEVVEARRAELAELDRQKAIYEAMLAAGSVTIIDGAAL